MFLSIGVDKREFEDSTPKELSCYLKAEIMRKKRMDRAAWEQGMYNFSAFSTSLSRALAAFGGKKSKAKYVEEPFWDSIDSQDEEHLTEEQKKEERKKLLMTLETMQANFELSKSRGD